MQMCETPYLAGGDPYHSSTAPILWIFSIAVIILKGHEAFGLGFKPYGVSGSSACRKGSIGLEALSMLSPFGSSQELLRLLSSGNLFQKS